MVKHRENTAENYGHQNKSIEIVFVSTREILAFLKNDISFLGGVNLNDKAYDGYRLPSLQLTGSSSPRSCDYSSHLLTNNNRSIFICLSFFHTFHLLFRSLTFFSSSACNAFSYLHEITRRDEAKGLSIRVSKGVQREGREGILT